MTLIVPMDQLSSHTGPLGYSTWIEVDQEMVDTFAALTDDEQWIHVDRHRACESPYGGTIAHGFLILSLLPPMLRDTLTVTGMTSGLNYGLDRVRFPSPLPVGRRVRGEVNLSRVEQEPDGSVQTWREVVIEAEGGGKPVCVTTAITRYLR
jgi:acyl dehydratase